MEDRQRINRIPVGVIAGLSAVVLAAGGGSAWLTWQSLNSAGVDPVSPTPAAAQRPTATPAAPAQEETVQVYGLQDTGTALELVPVEVSLPAADTPEAILTAAFTQLLDGSITNGVASTIPEGTELRSLSVEADGVHVDLSQEFQFGGGATSMSGRLGQVVYTATTLNSNAPVWISVEGEPLEVLGGEGIIVTQPMTRAEFDQNFAL